MRSTQARRGRRRLAAGLGARLGALAGVVVLATVLAGPALGAAPAPKITANDPCSMLTTRQVSTFGKPVVQDQASAFGYDCNYLVGADPKTAPGGVFTTIIEFPVLGVSVRNASAAVEDQHAIASLSDHELQDVEGVGRSAYFDRTVGSITVEATKTYAFTLTWREGGVDTPLDAATGKKLKRLARDIVRRAPR